MTTELFTLTPRNLEEAMDYAKLIADSDLVPKDYKNKPGNVMVAIQMGAEVGLKPMQALQNIAVISGKPCVYGDAMLAIVKAHREFIDIDEKIENGTAYCTILRKNQTPQTRSFSIEDAKKAGLFGKPGPWTQYANRMLQMRARGFALRDVFPDALKGIALAEEIIDLPSEDYSIVNVEEKKNNLLSKLKKSKEEEPINFETGEIISIENKSILLFEEVKNKIESAIDVNELIEAADLARQLQDEDEKKQARELYTIKKRSLDQLIKE